MKTVASFFVLLFFVVLYGHAQISSNKQLRKNSILESTSESGYSTLLQAVKAADLEQILNEDGPFTVFAPSDKAFAKMSKNKMKVLLQPENRKELFSLLTYHMVAGNLTASKMLLAMSRGNGKASFTTVQGNKIFASMHGLDIVLTDQFGNSAKITTADFNQRNGVIHKIDAVILPEML
ncbi:hypothetical protein KCTC52924_03907 [Arenibacter antarcticus]|uniref:Fasciclin domain-containing protein n=1 Tax=Arenibacter antarcticus TaxID=2040469 RepID=A0ABW5VF90_9FLAO|nr:fasciclin domain-containing protein [Arenibacter sp. H213]MCM4168340.1 beta-Ig-H3/fasciclin [Arenibacter sp. H213]